jgi:hypothetical protein
MTGKHIPAVLVKLTTKHKKINFYFFLAFRTTIGLTEAQALSFRKDDHEMLSFLSIFSYRSKSHANSLINGL